MSVAAVEWPITRVKLSEDHAQIYRVGTAQEAYVRVVELSHCLKEGSVRVQSTADDVCVQRVTVKKRPMVEELPDTDAVDRGSKIAGLREVCTTKVDGSIADSKVKGELNTAELVAELRARHPHIRFNKALAELRWNDILFEYQVAEASLRYEARTKHEVAFQSNKTDNKDTKYTMDYRVLHATWRPAYDLHIDTANNTMTITYVAVVKQNTGEDWNNVKISFSSAHTSAYGSPSPVPTKYLSYRSEGMSPPMARSSVRTRKSNITAAEDEVDCMAMDSMAPPRPMLAKAGAPQAEGRDEMDLCEQWELSALQTIESGKFDHRVVISETKLNCKLRHYLAPAIGEEVYLQINSTNNSGNTFPPSKEVAVWVDGDYVGESCLEAIAAGESFRTFGCVDRSIRVKHTSSKFHQVSVIAPESLFEAFVQPLLLLLPFYNPYTKPPPTTPTTTPPTTTTAAATGTKTSALREVTCESSAHIYNTKKKDAITLLVVQQMPKCLDGDVKLSYVTPHEFENLQSQIDDVEDNAGAEKVYLNKTTNNVIWQMKLAAGTKKQVDFCYKYVAANERGKAIHEF